MGDIYELKDENDSSNNTEVIHDDILTEIYIIKLELKDILIKKYPWEQSKINIDLVLSNITDNDTFKIYLDKILFNKWLDWDTYFHFYQRYEKHNFENI